MVYRSVKTRKEGAPRPGTGYRLFEVSNHLGKWDEVLNTPEKALYLQDEKADTRNQIERSYEKKDFSKKGFKYPLLNTTLVATTGKDVEWFLQSQVTCDVSKIEENKTLLTSWCSPNGRVKHLLNIIKVKGVIYLAIHSDLAEKFLSQIRIYVLNSDVVFKDVSESTLIFLTGKSNNHEAKWHLGSVSDTRKNWQSATEVPVAQATGTLFEINQSIPKLNLQLSEKFLPQELNLDTGNGLSFEKGCFPGQEIIARVKYRGNVKRRLRILQSAQPLASPPEAGDIVTNGAGKKIGTVLRVTLKPDALCVVQSVLDVSATELCYCNDNSDKLVAINS